MKKSKLRFLALLQILVVMPGLFAGCGQNDKAQLSAEATDTLSTLTKVDDNFYRMDYKADYDLDKILETGAASGDELAHLVSQQLLDGLPFGDNAPVLGCSAFTATTPEGDVIQGRNLDIADAQNTVVRTKPKDGYESLSTASGLMLGYIDSIPDSSIGRYYMMAAPYYPADGINEKGLSVAILMLTESQPTNQNRGKTPVMTSLAVRMLLDKAANVEEAIALLDAYDMHSIANVSIHFQLSDAEGNAAIVEYVGDEMRVLPKDKEYQAVTNFYLSPGVVDKEMDGKDRYDTIEGELSKTKGVASQEQAFDILDKIKIVDVLDEATGVLFNTSYSIVFNNSQKTMDVCPNMNYDKIYHFEMGDNFK